MISSLQGKYIVSISSVGYHLRAGTRLSVLESRNIGMFSWRQILALAFIPLTIWAGLPQIACLCSTGEFRLQCPQFRQNHAETPASPQTTCCSSHATKERAGCGTQGCRPGRGGQDESAPHHQVGCQSGCRCTPVLLESELQAGSSDTAPLQLQHQLTPLVVTEPVQLPAALNCAPALWLRSHFLCCCGDAAPLHERWLV